MPQSQKIIIANWKMRLGVAESVALARQCAALSVRSVEFVLCPSFVSLQPVRTVIKGSKLKLGAQDVFWEGRGAYTGEVSTADLREVGCEYVIVGHSERRTLGETDAMVHQKIRAAVEGGLTPILCVGETFDQRQEGARDYVLIQQISRALEGISFPSSQQLIVAYEPVWVIGTGHAITPDDAQQAHQVIHQSLVDVLPSEMIAERVRIIYGGSVDAANIDSFADVSSTSGALVGTASLAFDSLSEIVLHLEKHNR